MPDLKNPRVIKLKGILFLFTGIFASVLMLVMTADWRVAVLLAVAIWSFCRFYYFAFYVIEHYVDGDYKFAGLYSFFLYMVGRRKRD